MQHTREKLKMMSVNQMSIYHTLLEDPQYYLEFFFRADKDAMGKET